MANSFNKLIREQIQNKLKNYSELIKNPIPKDGWIHIIREALGMSSYVLADRIGCSRSNVTTMEKREKQGKITLEVLEQAARAMNCKLVYALVPLEPFDQLLEKQARVVARKKIQVVNHSMKLEEQGLNFQQLKQQEDDLVQELLKGNPKKLWNDDAI